MSANFRLTLAVVLVCALGQPVASGNEPVTESLPSFNESPGCGDLDGTRGPLAAQPGILDLNVPIYGPWGDFYGRTVGHAWAQRVEITLPNMVGTPKTLWVHERVLPALQMAIDNLEAQDALGNEYDIRYGNTWSWARYTIPPDRTFSFHAVGAAIDINSNTNPYRADNTLITDMPAWFVEAWTAAGWCWGGDWQSIKDTMHYSWKGPIHTPGYLMPPPQPPLVSATSFSNQVPYAVGFDELPGASDRHLVADIDRDGAADIVRLVVGDYDVSLLSAVARHNYRWAVDTATTPVEPADPSAPVLLADLTRDGRPDLVYILSNGGTVAFEVFEFGQDGLFNPTTVPTSVPIAGASAYLIDDFDRDGDSDLFLIRAGDPATVEVWLGPDFASATVTAVLGVPSAGNQFAIGDRDVDGIPDLYALNSAGTLVVHDGSSNFAETSTIPTGIDPSGETLFITDLDGDGHSDLMLVDGDGQMRLRRGGNSTHKPGVWFVDYTHAVSRLAGANRYETAAAVSKAHHPNPASVDTVFIATGVHFPDALAGGAIAGKLNAPLLLVTPVAVPAATAAELARLDPDTIVLLGGTGAISSAVENALGAYGTVVRIAGANRYATAVEASKFGYPVDGSADTVVIASGESFADALAGGTAAARLGGPVLLTTRNGLPAVTLAEIVRLDPDRIIVLGGTAAISGAVFDQLSAIADTERIAGSDRVQTAIAVSAAAFPAGSDRVYVATGTGFPDGLAGSAAAASLGSPILLLPDSGLPATVVAEILRLGAGEIVILGGTAVITASVQSALAVAGF